MFGRRVSDAVSLAACAIRSFQALKVVHKRQLQEQQQQQQQQRYGNLLI